MMRRFRRPSPAMIIACLALFVAMSSGTYAAVKLKANSVKTKTIKNSAVTEAKLATNAVSTTKIADSAVSDAKLAAASVKKGKFAASGVATNTNAFLLQNSCTVATFTATGVQPGDVVAFSLKDVPGVNGLLIAQPAEDEVTANGLKVQLCEVNNVAANIGIGQVGLDFVAVR